MSDIRWQKSSYSASNGESSCVELGLVAGRVHVRESDDERVVVVADPARVRALLAAVKRGAFDGVAARP
ncbi:DUF397 domain-containing protein [Streptomyces sp. 4N509B]|uniref:DUF397 domain-containing protein n=1 Tax=Streptomyces sp. 4N509B TaxID=3457413 RepID=UPI003FD49AFA